ncbi:hypothetical protein HUB98_13340 [Paenibacillus barcinonensis]|uniref:YmaF-like protein n=1 Tax=Paenibacillus barcinonensis TaxID=198119 RepID=A0ABX6Q4T2_PAEBA|nr:hypothetical protein [Paenibacillus barcinonensis]QKS57203.1 hypothetical protein HUB98_13340 [Paenibacillus barcinonensis]
MNISWFKPSKKMFIIGKNEKPVSWIWKGYSKAIESAPAISSGPSTRNTAGPSTSETTASNIIFSSGPSSTTTTGPKNISGATQTEGTYIGQGGHNHGIPSGTVFLDADGIRRTWVPSGNHSHAISLANHEHDMQHHHEIPGHVHRMEHTHDMNHTHEVPGHSHDILYGIFEGPKPSKIVIRVNGNVVPFEGLEGEGIDIIPFLSKDDKGKVHRGAWHSIEITPNDLGRIVASLNTQIFVNSRGGGDF